MRFSSWPKTKFEKRRGKWLLSLCPLWYAQQPSPSVWAGLFPSAAPSAAFLTSWLSGQLSFLSGFSKGDNVRGRREPLEPRLDAVVDRAQNDYRGRWRVQGQISLTDPDSRAMAAHTKVGVGYNIRVAVDVKNKRDNHFLDARFMCRALAEHLGLSSLTISEWAGLARERGTPVTEAPSRSPAGQRPRLALLVEFEEPASQNKPHKTWTSTNSLTLISTVD